MCFSPALLSQGLTESTSAFCSKVYGSFPQVGYCISITEVGMRAGSGWYKAGRLVCRGRTILVKCGGCSAIELVPNLNYIEIITQLFSS
jgi:hypothetical protein